MKTGVQLPLAGSIQCDICPHHCSLPAGATGRCMTISNQNGSIVNTGYGNCSILSVDKIEKRPFFHFKPGTKFLSVGFYGCSMRCSFCQNYTVSQNIGKHRKLSPKELISLCFEKEVQGIAFTYNEPTVHVDYLIDVFRISNGLDLAIKTNGFVTDKTRDDIANVASAINVDIKGDEEEYKRVCDAWFSPVLDSISYWKKLDVHLEISYLVLPRLVSDMDFHRRIRDFLAEVDRNIPVHLLYFYPFHNMTDEKYCVEDLIPVLDLFKQEMSHVYISNVFDPNLARFRNTYCPDCNDLMIDREKGVNVIKKECCDFQET